MSIYFNPNSQSEATPQPGRLFSGKKKHRLRLNSDNKDDKAISLTSNKTLKEIPKRDRWDKFLRSIGWRKWVLIAVKDTTAENQKRYAKVHQASLERLGINQQDVETYLNESGLDFTEHTKVKEAIKLADIKNNGMNLQKYEDLKGNNEAVKIAVTRNTPEAIQFVRLFELPEEVMGILKESVGTLSDIIKNKGPQKAGEELEKLTAICDPDKQWTETLLPLTPTSFQVDMLNRASFLFEHATPTAQFNFLLKKIQMPDEPKDDFIPLFKQLSIENQAWFLQKATPQTLPGNKELALFKKLDNQNQIDILKASDKNNVGLGISLSPERELWNAADQAVRDHLASTEPEIYFSRLDRNEQTRIIEKNEDNLQRCLKYANDFVRDYFGLNFEFKNFKYLSENEQLMYINSEVSPFGKHLLKHASESAKTSYNASLAKPIAPAADSDNKDDD